jgi:outer membrane protein OmpA-like peptidoglycan-associated protein
MMGTVTASRPISPRATRARRWLWCVPLFAWGSLRAAEEHQIPLIEGLTVMTAVASERQGDYETVQVVSDLSTDSFKMTISAEAPDDSGEVREISVSRVVGRDDFRNARIVRRYFHEYDPRRFPGTTPEFSGLLVSEIRSLGRTSLTYLEVEPEFGRTVITRTLSGSLARVGREPVQVTLQVNGAPQALRAWHVAGRLAEGGDGDDFDYVVLDDPDNPLILHGRGPGFDSSVTRIEFPQPSVASTSLERSLADQKHALVYGIYFKFARADIRAVSEPVLKEIAAALEKNPGWKLNIVGHTDGIGNEAANLSLSRRRAAAVKAALVDRFGVDPGRLSTGGFGASQPQAKNDTPEGRARNRRVELTRL